MSTKRLFRCAALLLGVCLLFACGSAKAAARPDSLALSGNERQLAAPADGAPIVIFTTSLGEVRCVLYPDIAPIAVDNFTGLVQEGYYQDTLFHRIVYGFIVQGGDATGTGRGGDTIWNGNSYPMEVSDTLHHYAGALCVAADPDNKDSGSSQFYFVCAPADSVDQAQQDALTASGARAEVLEAYTAVGGLPYLDYTDTVFGQVYEGMDVVDAIAKVKTDENGKPQKEVQLLSVTLDTYTAPAQ